VSAIDNFVARSERSEGGLIVFDDEERPIKPDPTAVR
jgi:hypothetical protein